MELHNRHNYFGGAAGKRFAALKKSYEAETVVRLHGFPQDTKGFYPCFIGVLVAARKDGHLSKLGWQPGKTGTIENVGMAARKDGMAGRKDCHTGEC